MTTTRNAYLIAYRSELLARYAWTANADKLNAFLDKARAGLEGEGTWSHTGDASTAAWRAIGGKGKPSLKALRALPAC